MMGVANDVGGTLGVRGGEMNAHIVTLCRLAMHYVGGERSRAVSGSCGGETGRDVLRMWWPGA